ncbi:TetR/AcrR family transcriptional regulator [Thiohalorhabdus sp.]|uniref:TetR/AcrR family transcriptional regulator n=1 Tax=Thiohalorhabdus sp. TaxID=3094134 RepID=UPI002FC39C27
MEKTGTVAPDTRAADGAGHIAEVAARLFARYGFKGVSMAALAREAGISKAAIFHHYPSKEALYYHVLQEACQETTAFLQDPGRGGKSADLALAEFSRYFMRHLFDNASVSQLVLRELLDGESERVRTLAEEVHGQNHQRLVTLIRRGQEDGLFDPDHDPSLVAVTLVGTQLFFFQAREALHHMPETGFAEDADGFAQGLTRLLLDGLRQR